ncbi:GrpB family protein [Rubrivivax albus]|uniref:GrpB family protein n=1 Tax=Rubrivivax albus TaxID=2499835 RepID=A0A437JJP0_9BURK|nr:GrpB family protein [Rubrivivax albus]RVT46828.1 GrpB family protein [Rubrivivax albus]
MSTVQIVDYQESWPSAFEQVASVLRTVMAGHQVEIEHTGSTAVPGLCAKPVLDVLLGVCALSEVESKVAELEQVGYQYRPEYEAQIPLRRYFVKSAEESCPRVHLHAVQTNGLLWQEHVAFRQALRSNSALADEYGSLKRNLASSVGKSEYTEAKAPFIRGVLGRVASGKAESAA